MEELCYPEIEKLRDYVDKLNGNTLLKIKIRKEIINLEKRIKTHILFLLNNKIDTKNIKNVQFENVNNITNFVYKEKIY